MSVYVQVEKLKDQAIQELVRHNHDRGMHLMNQALDTARKDCDFVLSALLYVQSQLSEALTVEGLSKESHELDSEIGGCLQDLSDEEDQVALKAALEDRRSRIRVPRGEPQHESISKGRHAKPQPPTQTSSDQ